MALVAFGMAVARSSIRPPSWGAVCIKLTGRGGGGTILVDLRHKACREMAAGTIFTGADMDTANPVWQGTDASRFVAIELPVPAQPKVRYR